MRQMCRRGQPSLLWSFSYNDCAGVHMRSATRVLAFCGLLLNIGVAQVSSPTASQLASMERFATQPTAHVTWSTEVDRIHRDNAQAVITALIVKDEAQPPRQVPGIRIDLTSPDGKNRV